MDFIQNVVNRIIIFLPKYYFVVFFKNIVELILFQLRSLMNMTKITSIENKVYPITEGKDTILETSAQFHMKKSVQDYIRPPRLFFFIFKSSKQ